MFLNRWQLVLLSQKRRGDVLLTLYSYGLICILVSNMLILPKKDLFFFFVLGFFCSVCKSSVDMHLGGINSLLEV